MTWLVFVLECLFVGMVAGFLIQHEDYEDGVVGRFALGLCTCVPCGLVVGEALLSWMGEVESATAWVPGIVDWVMFGICVFLGRHAYRFWCFRKCGAHAWHKSAEPESKTLRALT